MGVLGQVIPAAAPPQQLAAACMDLPPAAGCCLPTWMFFPSCRLPISHAPCFLPLQALAFSHTWKALKPHVEQMLLQ